MAKVNIKELNVWFKDKHVIQKVSLAIKEHAATAVMGPSGCGKTTLIRAINRMNEIISGSRTSGAVYIDEKNIYDEDTNVYELRRKVGMVFLRPNPFP